jgi:hypothetical protein
MAAFYGKDATEDISALSGLVPISPAAQAFPAVVPGLQVYLRDKPFVVFGLALERSRGDKWTELSTVASSKRSRRNLTTQCLRSAAG